MNIHDWLKANKGRSPLDHVTVADLIAITDSGGDTATVDPAEVEREQERTRLRAQLAALG